MASNDPADRRARARFILVEDSFPVADSLRFLLESVGCEVVGMAGNVSAALSLVATTPFDAAVLDIDLRGEHVAPVADAVREQGKAVIFLSGYGDEEALPAHLRSLPRLEKPVNSRHLFAVIERIVAGSGK